MLEHIFDDIVGFIIHLERSVERIPSISNLIKQLNMNISIINAVDGKNHSIHPRLCPSYTTIGCCINRSNGEIGCVLSHLKIWKHMIEQNIKYAIIFEDDCVATNNIKILEQVVYDEIHLIKDCDIILLGALGYHGYENIVNSNFVKVNRFDGTHALIITNATAKKCIEFYELETQKGYLHPVDSLYGSVNIQYNLKTIGFKNPFSMFYQNNLLTSTIANS